MIIVGYILLYSGVFQTVPFSHIACCVCRRIYLAYMDSVHFFKPRQFRTAVYHEILIGYLDYVKLLGYVCLETDTMPLLSCSPIIRMLLLGVNRYCCDCFSPEHLNTVYQCAKNSMYVESTRWIVPIFSVLNSRFFSTESCAAFLCCIGCWHIRQLLRTSVKKIHDVDDLLRWCSCWQ